MIVRACMECKFANVIRDNHKDFHFVCVCRESKNFLHEINDLFDECENGVFDDYGEESRSTEKGGAEK